MQQLRLSQHRITLLPQSHKLLFGDVVFQMLVQSPMIPNAHPRDGSTTFLRHVVVADPDFHRIRQAEEPTARVEQVARTAAGEIAACGADVDVEKRVAAEYVF